MPLSFVQHVGDGSTPNFSVPFGYLDKTHISVTVAGVPTTSYTWLTESQIQITPNPVGIVEIRRNTPKTVRSVVWVNAANLTETDLNVADLQVFYLVQEAADSASNSILLDNDAKFNAQNKVIKNLANGVAPNDAVNKAQLDTMSNSLQGFVDAATAQVALAEDQADIATAQAVIATTQAGIAATKATDATAAFTASDLARIAAEAAAAGMKWRPSVRMATTANITLSGLQTIDNIVGQAGDLVIVKNQNNQTENGVYVMSSSAWVRASDADTWLELVSQTRMVEEGDVNKDTFWNCTVNQGGTLGSTNITWGTFNATPAPGSVTNTQLANMVQKTIKLRKTLSTGSPEDGSASDLLDFITSNTGALLVRGSSLWQALLLGTALQQLRVNAAGTGLEWFTPGSSSVRLLNVFRVSCPTQTVTISNGSPASFTVTAQNRPRINTEVVLSTTGVLPSPLVVGDRYWVVDNPSEGVFRVSTTKGGTPIATSTAGSGTHTVTSAPYVKATYNPTFIRARVKGAGAGGSTGGGGAEGGTALADMILAASFNASEPVVVGLGGAVSTAGGNSTFLGLTGLGGSVPNPSNNYPQGAQGGKYTGGDYGIVGAPGVAGSLVSTGQNSPDSRAGGGSGGGVASWRGEPGTGGGGGGSAAGGCGFIEIEEWG